MNTVYIIYAPKDLDVAIRIAHAVTASGFRAELDEPDDVRDAGCVVVLWSESAANASESDRSIKSAVQAWSLDRLIVATLDDAPLPIGMRDLPTVSIRREPEPPSESELILDIRHVFDGLRSTTVAAHQDKDTDQSSIPELKARPIRASRFKYWAALASFVFIIIVAAAIQLTLNRRPAAIPPRHSHTTPTPPPTLPPEYLSNAFDYAILALVVGGLIGAGASVLVMRSIRKLRISRSGQAPLATVSPLESGQANRDVFVSYSHRDAEIVDELVDAIEQAGFTVWIDRQGVGSGRYAAHIVRAIRESRLIALMCSSAAFTSDHVIREIYVAGDYKKPFLALQIEPAEFPDEVPVFSLGVYAPSGQSS